MKYVIFFLCAALLCTSTLGFSLQKSEVALANDADLTDATPLELLDKFLEGFGLDDDIMNSTDCVHAMEKGSMEVKTIIETVKAEGFNWKNYLVLLDGLKQVANITKVCYDPGMETTAELRKFMASFAGFADFVEQAKSNIGTHFVDFLAISSELTNAINKKDNPEIALQIGKAAKLLFRFTPKMMNGQSSNDLQELPNLRPLEDFFKGFINGSDIFKSENMMKCVNETESIVKSIESAKEKFAMATPEGTKEGIFAIADILSLLKEVNEDCFEGALDVKTKAKEILAAFESPWAIGLNTLKHGSYIAAALVSLFKSIPAAQWKDVGENLGQIFKNIFIGDK